MTIDLASRAAESEAAPAFPCTSSGYLGRHHERASLNSKYFFEYWQAVGQGDDSVELRQFPLRVPRRGFFDEIQWNETPAIAQQLKQREAEVKKSACKVTVAFAQEQSIEALNILGAALRYGIFEFPELAQFPAPRPGNSNDYRVVLQLYIGKLSTAISQGSQPPFKDIQELSMRAHADAQMDPELRAHIFNTYLVASARYRDEETSLADGLLNQTSALLKAYLEGSSPAGFRACLSHSSLWRGLPMWDGLSEQEKTHCLDRAIRYADLAAAQTATERILKDENDVTLNLTLAKWHGRNDPAKKIYFLERILALDPWDSTAYSELGLHFYKAGEWAAAGKLFSKAIDLGPPALGMNAYFKAETELRLGREDAAEAMFLRASEIDPTGLSPRLSLISLFSKQGRSDDARRLAQSVLATPDLQSQLTSEESQELLALS